MSSSELTDWIVYWAGDSDIDDDEPDTADQLKMKLDAAIGIQDGGTGGGFSGSHEREQRAACL